MHRTITLIALCALTGVAGAQYKTSTPNAKPIPVATVPAAPTAEQQLAGVRRISEVETYRLFKNGSAVIVDVRSNAQFQLGHIKGSVNIPGSQLLSRMKELPPRKMIITYCACSAEQSAGRAVLELNNHGVKNTAALKGGWNAWKAANLPMAAGPN